MWYPSKVVTPPQAEPVTIDIARVHVRVDVDEEDDLIARLIAVARSHVEKYCGIRLPTQTIEASCDGFGDFARLSEAPVQSIASITYVDGAGVTQTLPGTVYEGRFDGFDTSIVLKPGQSWPQKLPGSRITVRMIAGSDQVDPTVAHAILLHVSDSYYQREPVVIAGRTVFDNLLCNHRRGI